MATYGSIFCKKFLLDVLERVVRSFFGGYAAQAVVGDAAIFSKVAFEYGLAAAGASLILALASKPVGDLDSASVIPDNA